MTIRRYFMVIHLNNNGPIAFHRKCPCKIEKTFSAVKLEMNAMKIDSLLSRRFKFKKENACLVE